jgi:hypothetical protein
MGIGAAESTSGETVSAVAVRAGGRQPTGGLARRWIAPVLVNVPRQAGML